MPLFLLGGILRTYIYYMLQQQQKKRSKGCLCYAKRICLKFEMVSASSGQRACGAAGTHDHKIHTNQTFRQGSLMCLATMELFKK